MILLAAAFALAGAAGPAPAPPPILDNAMVTVTRTKVTPGARIEFSPNMSPVLIVMLSEGDAQIRSRGENSRGLHPAGFVTFAPRGESLLVINKGAGAFDLLTIWIKPQRPPAPAAPSTEAPEGITRTTLIDNTDVRVVRVRFAPGSREPVHTHPNDLLTVQLTPGTIEVLLGSDRAQSRKDAGAVTFLPRDVPHAYVSTDAQPFELLSISIK